MKLTIAIALLLSTLNLQSDSAPIILKCQVISTDDTPSQDQGYGAPIARQEVAGTHQVIPDAPAGTNYGSYGFNNYGNGAAPNHIAPSENTVSGPMPPVEPAVSPAKAIEDPVATPYGDAQASHATGPAEPETAPNPATVPSTEVTDDSKPAPVVPPTNAEPSKPTETVDSNSESSVASPTNVPSTEATNDSMSAPSVPTAQTEPATNPAKADDSKPAATAAAPATAATPATAPKQVGTSTTSAAKPTPAASPAASQAEDPFAVNDMEPKADNDKTKTKTSTDSTKKSDFSIPHDVEVDEIEHGGPNEGYAEVKKGSGEKDNPVMGTSDFKKLIREVVGPDESLAAAILGSAIAESSMGAKGNMNSHGRPTSAEQQSRNDNSGKPKWATDSQEISLFRMNRAMIREIAKFRNKNENVEDVIKKMDSVTYEGDRLAVEYMRDAFKLFGRQGFMIVQRQGLPQYENWKKNNQQFTDPNMKKDQEKFNKDYYRLQATLENKRIPVDKIPYQQNEAPLI